MLGTLFFTVLVFLFTTVAIYCASFGVFFWFVLLLQLVLRISIVILNNIPLYDILFVNHKPSKDAHASAVWFKLLEHKENHVYFSLCLQRNSLQAFFKPLSRDLWNLIKTLCHRTDLTQGFTHTFAHPQQ